LDNQITDSNAITHPNKITAKIGQLKVERDFLESKLGVECRAACDGKPPHLSLSLVRQRALLDISHSGLYYKPTEISEADDTLMKLIDRQCLATPFYGACRMATWLKSKEGKVNRKHIRRLMRVMGIKSCLSKLWIQFYYFLIALLSGFIIELLV